MELTRATEASRNCGYSCYSMTIRILILCLQLNKGVCVRIFILFIYNIQKEWDCGRFVHSSDVPFVGSSLGDVDFGNLWSGFLQWLAWSKSSLNLNPLTNENFDFWTRGKFQIILFISSENLFIGFFENGRVELFVNDDVTTSGEW